MLRKGAIVISSILGGAALFAGAFYFLLGQINRVDDQAKASVKEVASVSSVVSGLTEKVNGIEKSLDEFKKNSNTQYENLNNKLNIILSR